MTDSSAPYEAGMSRRSMMTGVAGVLCAAAFLGRAHGSEAITSTGKLKVVAFDVIETLFDIKGLAPLFQAAGFPEGALQIWFPRVLKSAFAMEVTKNYASFKDVATSELRSFMKEHQIEPTEEKIKSILSGFGQLAAHPDVEPCFKKLQDAGIRIITLTNGNAETTGNMLQKAGLDGYIEKIITIDEVKHWKPAREVYLHGANSVGVSPGEMLLVAAHDWDVHGAKAAGLQTAWINRQNGEYSKEMLAPDVTGTDLYAVTSEVISRK